MDFPGSKFIVSSRPAAIDSPEPLHIAAEMANLEFSELNIEPLSLTDSDALIVNWHAAVAQEHFNERDRDRLKANDQALRRILRDRPAVRNLASNPLLCSMICALNWDRNRLLPNDRMELYRLALEMLLDRRDPDRAIGPMYIENLGTSDKETLLDGIAYWMLRNRYSEADRARVEDQIKLILPRLSHISASAAQTIQELVERTGVLRQPQFGIVDFIHRTFLEYMGARGAIAVDDTGLLVNGARDENWREPIIFAAGHLQQKARDSFIGELIRFNFPLFKFKRRSFEVKVTAVCCLETVGRNLDPTLLLELHDLAKDLFPPADLQTARLLISAAEIEPDLLLGHESADQKSIAGCIDIAATLGGERMLEAIATYARVPGDDVDRAIMDAWAAFNKEEFFQKVVKVRKPIFQSFIKMDEEVAEWWRDRLARNLQVE
jgi:hypothetical protein